MVKRMLEKLNDSALANGPRIQLVWVPAHANGQNERADTLARMATSDESESESESASPCTLACSMTCATTELTKLSQSCWATIYAKR